jgi:peptidoglycan/LPS O-acetylase OafA/YrhL
MLITVGIASVSWRYFEKPLLKRRPEAGGGIPAK